MKVYDLLTVLACSWLPAVVLISLASIPHQHEV